MGNLSKLIPRRLVSSAIFSPETPIIKLNSLKWYGKVVASTTLEKVRHGAYVRQADKSVGNSNKSLNNNSNRQIKLLFYFLFCSTTKYFWKVRGLSPLYSPLWFSSKQRHLLLDIISGVLWKCQIGWRSLEFHCLRKNYTHTHSHSHKPSRALLLSLGQQENKKE